MEKKYEALRTIVKIQIVIGWIVIILGCLTSILNLKEYWGQGILGIITSVVVGLFLIAMAQLIQVLIDIEENTRNFSINQVQLAKLNTNNSTNTKSSTNSNFTDDKNNFDGVRLNLSKEARGDLKK